MSEQLFEVSIKYSHAADPLTRLGCIMSQRPALVVRWFAFALLLWSGSFGPIVCYGLAINQAVLLWHQERDIGTLAIPWLDVVNMGKVGSDTMRWYEDCWGYEPYKVYRELGLTSGIGLVLIVAMVMLLLQHSWLRNWFDRIHSRARFVCVSGNSLLSERTAQRRLLVPVVLASSLSFLCVLGLSWENDFAWQPPDWSALVFGTVMSGLAMVAAVFMASVLTRPEPITQLPDRMLWRCVRCGYHVGPTIRSGCPECGQTLGGDHRTPLLRLWLWWKQVGWLKRLAQLLVVYAIYVSALIVYEFLYPSVPTHSRIKVESGRVIFSQCYAAMQLECDNGTTVIVTYIHYVEPDAADPALWSTTPPPIGYAAIVAWKTGNGEGDSAWSIQEQLFPAIPGGSSSMNVVEFSSKAFDTRIRFNGHIRGRKIYNYSGQIPTPQVAGYQIYGTGVHAVHQYDRSVAAPPPPRIITRLWAQLEESLLAQYRKPVFIVDPLLRDPNPVRDASNGAKWEP